MKRERGGLVDGMMRDSDVDVDGGGGEVKRQKLDSVVGEREGGGGGDVLMGGGGGSGSGVEKMGMVVEEGGEGEGDVWKKVEKRKRKKEKSKMRKGNQSQSFGQGGSQSQSQGQGGGRHGPTQTQTAPQTLAQMQKTQPRFLYSNTEIVKRGHAVSIDDVRDLVIHLVADGPGPNWLRVDNGRNIEKVVTLLVPGLTPELLALPPIPTCATVNPNLPLSIPLLGASTDATPVEEKEEWGKATASCIPFIAKTFSHACPTRAPGDQTRMHSVLSTFFNGPVSGEKKRRAKVKSQEENVDRTDPMRYILTLEQMMENEYPVPSYMADVSAGERDREREGWVETPRPPSPEETRGKKPKVYAIDCEMCLTEKGKELTRVCVIDFESGVVVYDELVKPEEPIVDYLTRWSGIREEDLRGVTRRRKEVQERLMKIFNPVPVQNPFSSSSSKEGRKEPTPILLGHSLESDLNALRISHPLVIDTALLFHHPRGRPLKPGLAWLTKKWLGREIQTRGEGGHDAQEDAYACVELVKRKMKEGDAWGTFKMDWESIFERMGRVTGGNNNNNGGGGVRSAVVDLGNPGVMHGSRATSCVACKSDEEVYEGLVDVIPTHRFVFGRFMGLANALGWVTPKGTNDPPPTADPTPKPPAAPNTNMNPPKPSASTLSPVLKELNDHLSKIYALLPPRTALIIFTGHEDPRRMSGLNVRKGVWESWVRNGSVVSDKPGEESPRWTAQDGRDLEEAVERAKRGLMFLGVK